MSRLYKISKRYIKYRNLKHNFILNVLARRFIRDGKYLRAKKLLVETFEIIKSKEPYNVYLIFLIALYNISLRISFVAEFNPDSKKLSKKKKLLTKFDSLLFGLKLLLENYKKNKGRSLCVKLSNEIISSFYKKSFSYKKKLEFERDIIKSTAKKVDRKRQVKFSVIN